MGIVAVAGGGGSSSGTVSVSNFPASQQVTQGTSPWVVSGTVAANQGTSPWVVSGTVAATQSGSWTVGVNNFPATQPVSGTVAVSNFPATQPVSGTVTANQGTSPWVVSGTVNSAQSGAWTVTANQGTSPWVVSGTVNVGNTVTVTGSVTTTATGMASPTTSLNAQSTVQNGTVLDDGGMREHHTITLISGAGVSSGTVIFQTSMDNTNWFNAVTFSTTTASVVASADVVGAFRYSRAAITVAITGGTVTALIASV